MDSYSVWLISSIAFNDERVLRFDCALHRREMVFKPSESRQNQLNGGAMLSVIGVRYRQNRCGYPAGRRHFPPYLERGSWPACLAW